MYEKETQPLLPRSKFVKRFMQHFGVSVLILIFSLGIGVIGYHLTEKLSWLDSLLNASMILGGMGPVDVIKTVGGKLFASFYALYSGIIFIAIAGVMLVPVLHRLLHSLHLTQK